MIGDGFGLKANIQTKQAAQTRNNFTNTGFVAFSFGVAQRSRNIANVTNAGKKNLLLMETEPEQIRSGPDLRMEMP